MSSVHPNILLVEDDPNDVLLIKRAFRKINFSHPLQVVEDGEEAVAYLAGQSLYVDRERYPLPSLILLDIKLPRKSGFEVLDWLRKQPALKRLPVVVVTSSRDSIDINRAYDLYANSYLVKPFNFNDWLEMVEALNIYWLTLNEDPDLEF
ncbi:response regulator [candidate division WOR-3 bacterium]|nr:response regulator [candidate division WOR-3 bacterium]